MQSTRARQREIVFHARGGRRRGAGRPPVGDRAGVSHAARPQLSGREPALVTLKMREHVWNLRARRAFERLLPVFFAGCERLGMRLVHFSVQRDHIHLVVEAADAIALSRGVQGLSVRVARALNRMMNRTGKVFADRFHERVLATPRQVRTALAYVLCNARKHGVADCTRRWLDPLSSARAFDGWLGVTLDPVVAVSVTLARARTWLLSTGWRRAGGPIDPDHVPGAMPA